MFNSSKQCLLILQNTLLTGISDVSFSSPVKEQYQNLLGGASVKRKINSPQETTCQFSKVLNGPDFLQSLTGQENMSGQFIYGTGGLDFNKATISNYSLSLDKDGFGQISVEMKIRGDIKPATSLRSANASGDIAVTDQTPFIQFLDIAGTNPTVNSISIQSTINSKPTYEIGSINSSNVKIISPVVNKISTNIEMLDEQIEDITGLVKNDNLTKNISLVLGDINNKANAAEIAQARITAEKIKNSGVDIDDLDFGFGACAFNAFEFPKASINSQNLQSTAGDIVKLKKDYTAYYNPPSNESVIQHPPTSQVACNIQIDTVRESLNTAFERLGQIRTVQDLVGFEDLTPGANNININLIEKIKNFTNFEDPIEFPVNENNNTNLFSLTTILDIVGFELDSDSIEQISTNIFDLDKVRQISGFELETPGNTNNHLNILTSDLFLSGFENLSPENTNDHLFFLIDLIPDFLATTGESFEGSAKANKLGDRKTNLVLIDKVRQISGFENEAEAPFNTDMQILQNTVDLSGFENEAEAPFNTDMQILQTAVDLSGFEDKTEGPFNTDMQLLKTTVLSGFENEAEGNSDTNLYLIN